MATIEERAKGYTKRNGTQYLSGFEQAEYYAYIHGAIEQKAIDDDEWRKDMRYMNIQKQKLIDKACEWLKDELCKLAMDKIEEAFLQNDFKVILKEDVPKWIDDFRKSMEE